MAFSLISCQKQTVQNESDSVEHELKTNPSKDKFVNLVVKNELLKKIDVHLPSKYTELIRNQTKSSLEERSNLSIPATKLAQNEDYSFYKSIVARAIDPDDYECNSTILDDYFYNALSELTDYEFIVWAILGNIGFDYYWGFYNTQSPNEYYGPTGTYTNVLSRSYRDLKRFWNIPTDIIIGAAHGNIFNDVSKIRMTLEMLYGVPAADANEMAEIAKEVFGSDAFQSFKSPLLTFNAFAEKADVPFTGNPKKIIMGDGIMDVYKIYGYGDVAPQAILAHEYGHQIQFANNSLTPGSYINPEETRQDELGADAYSAYFLTHKRGAAMNWKRVNQFLEVFYSVGDCGFDQYWHHGTPNQRMKAAAFGYQCANEAQMQGKIMTSQEFYAKFLAELPNIIAPDAY